MARKLDRTGETNINTFGSKMKIIKYIDRNNIEVKFDNGYIKKTQYDSFKNGSVKSPYCKSSFGIGYIGEGLYAPHENGKKTNRYTRWESMIGRCYNKEFQKRCPTYIDCSIDEEWLNFQKFSEWYDNNYYEIEGEKMCLDKDILFKKNKIYSPNTCIFVPERINMLFIKNTKKRSELPVGVYKDKQRNKFYSNLKIKDKKTIILGRHNTVEETFNIYKKAKEKHIKEVAEEYKDRIPIKLYEAMCNYKIEITD
jgi:hypothetical protein